MGKELKRYGNQSVILFTPLKKRALENKNKSSLDTTGKDETLCPGIRTSSSERRKCPDILVSSIKLYASCILKCTQMRPEKTENNNKLFHLGVGSFSLRSPLRQGTSISFWPTCIAHTMAWPAPQHPCAQMQTHKSQRIHEKQLLLREVRSVRAVS